MTAVARPLARLLTIAAIVLALVLGAVDCEPTDPRGPDGWRTEVPS